MQRFPRSRRIGSCRHKITFIRCTEIHIEFSLIITNCPCPNTSAITIHTRPVHFFTDLSQIRNHMTFNRPVHQILGMYDHHTWGILKGRRNSIIIISHTNTINVTVIGRKDRITIGAISLITPSCPFSPLVIILCKYIYC